MHRIALATAVAASVSLGFAASLHAQDAGTPVRKASLDEQRQAVAKAEAALATWAKAEDVESPLREEIRGFASQIFQSPKRPLSGPDALTESEIHDAIEQCLRFAGMAEVRRRELLGSVRELATFDVRSIIGMSPNFPGSPIGARPNDHDVVTHGMRIAHGRLLSYPVTIKPTAGQLAGLM